MKGEETDEARVSVKLDKHHAVCVDSPKFPSAPFAALQNLTKIPEFVLREFAPPPLPPTPTFPRRKTQQQQQQNLINHKIIFACVHMQSHTAFFFFSFTAAQSVWDNADDTVIKQNLTFCLNFACKFSLVSTDGDGQ